MKSYLQSLFDIIKSSEIETNDDSLIKMLGYKTTFEIQLKLIFKDNFNCKESSFSHLVQVLALKFYCIFSLQAIIYIIHMILSFPI